MQGQIRMDARVGQQPAEEFDPDAEQVCPLLPGGGQQQIAVRLCLDQALVAHLPDEGADGGLCNAQIVRQSHESDAMEYADRSFRMDGGQLIAEADPKGTA